MAKKSASKPALSLSFYEKTWAKYLHIGKAKGWRMSRVCAVFHAVTGIWPREANFPFAIPRTASHFEATAAEWLAFNRPKK